MIEHNRKDNCIQFLGIGEEERVLFCRDTTEGLWFYPDRETWQSGELYPQEKLTVQRGSYDDVIYRMDACLKGDRIDLQNKMSRVFEYAVPQGRLVLLMDNPYALHLFAGEADGHGELFGSLQRHPAGQRMISYKMLKEALINVFSGEHLRWYYPYPTIDFPVCIYSEDYEPKAGECTESFYNFEHARLELFSETDAFDEVVKSGLFPEFANCYMIVAGKPLKKKIYYTRYSNERAEGLRIRTDILPDGVCKAAADAASKAHMERLARWEERLGRQLAGLKWEGRRVQVNRIVRKEPGRVTFEYVPGISLEQRLDELLAEGDNEKAKQLLFHFCSLLRQQPDLEPFVCTETFTSVFGTFSEEEWAAVSEEGSLLAAPVTDIDMICRNLLLGEGEDAAVTVIDYEWTFDFPIPADYVIYRMLFFYLEFGGRRERFGDFDFYEALSITKRRRELFAQMETNFQRYVQGDVTLLSDAYYVSGKPVLSIKEIKKQLFLLEKSRIRLRLKTAGGWREEERAMKKDADGIVSFTIDFAPGEVTEIELLPDVSGALLRTCLLQEDAEGSRELAFTANGISLNPLLYLFDEPAEIRITELCPETHRIYVSLEVVALPDTFVVESKRSLCDLKETLANRDEQLNNLYHSTSWRITRPLRKLKGNE
ncbi:MAG: hypothetical protein IJ711_05440 [Lachnospiraceae bacterium]|nr:hypothetical protein [Lachnospiraceae bacterium]